MTSTHDYDRRKTAGWREMPLLSNEIDGKEILKAILADRGGKVVFQRARTMPVLEFEAPRSGYLAAFTITARDLPNVRIVGTVSGRYESHSAGVSLWTPTVSWMIDF